MLSILFMERIARYCKPEDEQPLGAIASVLALLNLAGWAFWYYW
jgi:hypothetical protein